MPIFPLPNPKSPLFSFVANSCSCFCQRSHPIILPYFQGIPITILTFKLLPILIHLFKPSCVSPSTSNGLLRVINLHEHDKVWSVPLPTHSFSAAFQLIIVVKLPMSTKHLTPATWIMGRSHIFSVHCS